MSIKSFQDLIAWQKGMDLVVLVYEAIKGFPPDERFGLTSQVRRAAVSIPSNVAEGYGRRTRADYAHFVDVALGSSNELETQLLIALRLQFGNPSSVDAAISLTREIQRILKGLVESLEKSPKSDIRCRTDAATA